MKKQDQQVLLDNLAADRAARRERARTLPDANPQADPDPGESLLAKIGKRLGPLSTPDG